MISIVYSVPGVSSNAAVSLVSLDSSRLNGDFLFLPRAGVAVIGSDDQIYAVGIEASRGAEQSEGVGRDGA